MTSPVVLIVTPSLRRGGAERHAVLMATTMNPASWTPVVVAFADGPLRAELNEAGVEVELIEHLGRLDGLLAGFRALQRIVERRRPVLMSGHDVFVELVGRAVAHRTRVPLLVWKHVYGHIGYRGHRERLIETFAGSAVTRYGAVCHTQVRYLTDELRLPAERIRVVPNTVKVRPVAEAPTGRPTVAMVAAMRVGKGHADALSAWRHVASAVPNARLVLAGDGPLRGALQLTAKTLGIGDSVEFVGEVADPLATIANCDTLLLASTTIECFPYVGLEAMSVGRPVVSTNVGGLPEMVEDGVTGRLVPPGDPLALGRALITSVSDRETTVAQGLAARERLERALPFSRWQAQVANLFSEVASGAITREEP